MERNFLSRNEANIYNCIYTTNTVTIAKTQCLEDSRVLMLTDEMVMMMVSFVFFLFVSMLALKKKM